MYNLKQSIEAVSWHSFVASWQGLGMATCAQNVGKNDAGAFTGQCFEAF